MMEQHNKELADVKQRNRELELEIRVAKRAKGAAEGHVEERLAVAEHDRLLRAKEAKAYRAKVWRLSQVNSQLEDRLDETKDKLKAANLRMVGSELRAGAAVKKLLSSARASTLELATLRTVHAAELDADGIEYAALAEQLVEIKDVVDTLTKMNDSLKDVVLEQSCQASEITAKHDAEIKAKDEAHDMLKTAVGVDTRYASVPKKQFEGDTTKLYARASYETVVKRHLTTVLDGRCDDDESLGTVAKALAASGDDVARRLLDTKEFAPIQKTIVSEALEKLQEHWSARLSVHLWDRLDLSDNKMDTLRHLLSFVYNRTTDKYVPVKVWVNPHDEKDFLVSTQIANRPARKKEFDQIANTCNIIVGADGHCQRDAETLIDLMYNRFHTAMRSNFSATRPAMPILFLDATGAALGRGITHCEAGSADFEGGAKQSRSTLVPLGLYEGSDKQIPLRENLDLVIPSWNRIIAAGYVTINGKHIPAMPLTSADMQGTKALYGMTCSSHSVWCTCKGEQQHKYPTTEVSDYDEMLAAIDAVGCEIKSFEDMCGYAHFSPGVACGGRFTKFKCKCCGYSPTEKQWKADRKAFSEMTDEQQAKERASHNEIGVEISEWDKHFHQMLFLPPATMNGMESAGVDQLHLVYLNIFKHLFDHTIHRNLPGAPHTAPVCRLMGA